MRVIYKLPGQEPEIIEVDNTLEALQKRVKGYLQTVTLFEDATVICNEEGRIYGMEHNVNILGVDFCGPILVVGVAGDEFTDLSDAGMDMLLPYLRRGE